MKRLTIQPKDLDKAITGVFDPNGFLKPLPLGGYSCQCVVAVAAARDWKNHVSVNSTGRVWVSKEKNTAAYVTTDPLLEGIIRLFDEAVGVGPTSPVRQEKFATIRKMLPVTFTMEKA